MAQHVEYCGSKEEFYLSLNKRKTLSTTKCLLGRLIYDKAVEYLRGKQEYIKNPNLTNWEHSTIARKKCTYSHGMLLTED